MKPICNVKDFTGEGNDKSLSTQVFPSPIYGKGRILEYLRSFPATYAAAMSLKDEITGQTLDSGVSGYEDEEGGWFWDDRMIYHFEKYNMKLSEEFIDYVLSR